MLFRSGIFSYFFFNDTATTEIYTLSLHDALPILEGFRCLKIGPFINLGIPDPGLDWDYKREKARCWLQNALFIFSSLETTSILTGKNGITDVKFTRQQDFRSKYF